MSTSSIATIHVTGENRLHARSLVPVLVRVRRWVPPSMIKRQIAQRRASAQKVLMQMALGKTERTNNIGDDGRQNKFVTGSLTDEGRDHFAFGRYFSQDLQRHTIEILVGKVDYDSVRRELEQPPIQSLSEYLE